jgi:hypothetical protein
LKEFLEIRGFKGKIVGETIDLPDKHAERGLEIQDWMTKNAVSKEQIVILDDRNDMAHLRDRLVLTSFYTGLLDRHVEEAINMF